MRRARVAAVLALAALAGCGDDRAVTILTPPPPPGVVGVFPAPGAQGVAHDTEIWARFDRAIDTTAVTDTTIALRLDAAYVPVALRWSEGATRVMLRPLAPLRLLRTHTVRLTAPLRARDGGRLGATYAWQFRTRALRTPSDPWPPDGTPGESPFVRLAWSLVGAPGGVTYEVRWSPDSAAVAAGAGTVRATTSTELFPPARWGADSTYYWRVIARHAGTGEESVGPIWRFTILPADTPTETVVLPLSDWGYLDRSTVAAQVCFSSTILAGGETFLNAVRWDLEPYRGRKLAGAALQLGWVSTGARFTNPALIALSYWDACAIAAPGPPFETRQLAGSHTAFDGATITFDAFGVTAHLEAMIRYRGYHGFRIRTSSRQDYDADECRLTLRLYREDPATEPRP